MQETAPDDRGINLCLLGWPGFARLKHGFARLKHGSNFKPMLPIEACFSSALMLRWGRDRGCGRQRPQTASTAGGACQGRTQDHGFGLASSSGADAQSACDAGLRKQLQLHCWYEGALHSGRAQLPCCAAAHTWMVFLIQSEAAATSAYSLGPGPLQLQSQTATPTAMSPPGPFKMSGHPMSPCMEQSAPSTLLAA